TANRASVLILGGGDGLGLREVWKYNDVKKVTMTDLDPAMTALAPEHPILNNINRSSMRDPRLTVINRDANAFLKDDNRLYGVIIIDLPDPDTIDLMHLYSERFYKLVRRHLIAGGVMVTQAASPHFAPQAFRCIIKTITAAGFSVLPYHNQIPTMGEWGWVLAVRNNDIDAITLKK
ncbi:MAG: spermidine synthase, partial [Planctomycetes bacterium]|nr:spermidine synthase [Planctomycetota bacterium]